MEPCIRNLLNSPAVDAVKFPNSPPAAAAADLTNTPPTRRLGFNGEKNDTLAPPVLIFVTIVVIVIFVIIVVVIVLVIVIVVHELEEDIPGGNETRAGGVLDARGISVPPLAAGPLILAISAGRSGINLVALDVPDPKEQLPMTLAPPPSGTKTQGSMDEDEDDLINVLEVDMYMENVQDNSLLVVERNPLYPFVVVKKPDMDAVDPPVRRDFNLVASSLLRRINSPPPSSPEGLKFPDIKSPEDANGENNAVEICTSMHTCKYLLLHMYVAQ